MNEDHLLQVDSWYGMTMWPGYAGYPYHSPIRIIGLDMYENEEPDDVIDMEFYNAAYAAGVRNMTYKLKVFTHQPTYLLAKLFENPKRAVAIEPLTPDWIKTFFPQQYCQLEAIARREDLSLEDAILQLARQW